jgi:hypothetical protein
MTIYEQKDLIEDILKNIYKTKKDIIKNVCELVNYIDPEVFNIAYEEDKNIVKLIQKRVDYLSSLLIDNLKEKLKESETIDFKISKSNLAQNEPICYIYGFKKVDDNEEFKFKSLHVNSYLENKNAFLIILDLINGYKLVPWK